MLKEIGSGSHGSVYQAVDPQGRDVAVKIIRNINRNNYSAICAYREVKILTRITNQKNRFVPQLLSAFLSLNDLVLVMERNPIDLEMLLSTINVNS